MLAKARGGDSAPSAPPASAAPSGFRPAGPLAAQPMHQGQPPPPNTPAPFDVKSTSWRMYTNAQGLPYYHNAQTGVTQWERPAGLPPVYGAQPAQAARSFRQSPY
mmetsp:Transcript_50871/g.136549  ORF Transcript_50871/g.136549 Transcript_50871/m.136549 type:complete len:105 (-) Transcript_50871:39-353(-)